MAITSEIKMTTKVRRARRDIPAKLVQLKAELGQLGLFKTMHAMEEAVTAVGYEIAEDELKMEQMSVHEWWTIERASGKGHPIEVKFDSMVDADRASAEMLAGDETIHCIHRDSMIPVARAIRDHEPNSNRPQALIDEQQFNQRIKRAQDEINDDFHL